MSGETFGVSLTELARIQKDWQAISERMAAMSRQVGEIKATVAKAAGTDLMASEFAGIVGFGAVAYQVAKDVSDILQQTEQLQQAKEKLTKEIGEDVEKIKQVAKEYEETERKIHDGMRKHDKPHDPPKSPGQGSGSTGSGSTGSGGHGGGHGAGHEQPKPPNDPGGHGGDGGHGGGSGPTPPPSDAGRISLDSVTYGSAGSWKSGEAACTDYIHQALDKMGITDPAARERWTRGMLTIVSRESSYNSPSWQVNKSDSNAHGAHQSDGAPAGSSRGGWQCVPGTFAAYHQAGTSTDIYDPVANCAAAMNYVMGEYHVSRDGSNLAAKVQQADPGRPAHGY